MRGEVLPPRESKSKETGEVLRSRRGARPKTVRHPAKIHTPREKILHGPRPDDCWLDDLMRVGKIPKNSRKVVRHPTTPVRYFSRNVDEFLEE